MQIEIQVKQLQAQIKSLEHVPAFQGTKSIMEEAAFKLDLIGQELRNSWSLAESLEARSAIECLCVAIGEKL